MTSSTTNESHGFLVFYQGFLAVAAVLVFFTKLDGFLEVYGYGIPLIWLCGFLVASIPLWITIRSRIKYFPVPILVWSCFYLAMSTISILILPQMPDMQLLEDQIRSLLALFLMVFLFSQHQKVLHWARVAILAVSLMNVFNHIYEFLNPYAFGALHAVGRPAGFYLNSNMAGCALITGMIVTIDLIKPKFRIFYTLFILIGVALTFSRGSLMAWFVIIAFMIWKKIIPSYQTVFFTVAITTFMMILFSQANNLSHMKAADGTPLFNEDTLTRIEFITDPLSEKQDTSRVNIAEESWQKFTQQPIIGQGLGSSANSNHISVKGTAQQPHNAYLTLIIEYGFLGFFLYPTLLLASIWKIKGQLKNQGIAFVGFFLMWGIFSHTVMSSFFTLLLFALMANLTEQSKHQIQ